MNGTLIAKFKENDPSVLISLEMDEGKIVKKNVLIDDFINSINSTHKIHTGILPKGTRFFSGNNNEFVIGIETPSMVKLCKCYIKSTNTEQKISLPFPHCLFVFEVSNGKVLNSYVFSLKESIVSETAIFYMFPYGNTYFAGNVCWGRIVFPKISKPLNTAILVSMFLDSGFNGDLYHSDSTVIAGNNGKSFENLIGFLKDKDNFPLEILNKSEKLLKDIFCEGE